MIPGFLIWLAAAGFSLAEMLDSIVSKDNGDEVQED